ncbi:tetratricopeptide repeat protein [Euzebya tangerina]|uniref:tetratricopeptide repeat protein n=1 Tax=Euzebya tangerina TaxID=591198 RepID=UPI000E3223BD|nr:tetratricopeptide repeat protein [Euzebya tangerina]
MSTVRDVDSQTFQTEVIEASKSRPVVVDFWAAWCGPCRQLSPLLETMAERFAGTVDVVKVDVDSNQALAQQYRVQGIPAVKAFVDGRLASEFTGVQPEPVIENFFASLGPSPADQLVTSAPTAADPAAVYQEALDLEADHPAAAIGLAGILAADGNADEARAVLARARPTPEVAQAIAELDLGAGGTADVDALQAAVDAGDDDARVPLGRALAAGGQHQDAIAVLLDGVRTPATKDDARTALLDVFTVLGNDHDLVKSARPRLAAALF